MAQPRRPVATAPGTDGIEQPRSVPGAVATGHRGAWVLFLSAFELFSRTVSIFMFAVRLINEGYIKGEPNEQGTGTRWHAKGRFHSDIGRQAGSLGHQRTSFCGLGALSSEGITRRPEPDLCVANQRLVRTGHSAIERRRQDVGSC